MQGITALPQAVGGFQEECPVLVYRRFAPQNIPFWEVNR